jgi:hypothetical protein
LGAGEVVLAGDHGGVAVEHGFAEGVVGFVAADEVEVAGFGEAGLGLAGGGSGGHGGLGGVGVGGHGCGCGGCREESEKSASDVERV